MHISSFITYILAGEIQRHYIFLHVYRIEALYWSDQSPFTNSYHLIILDVQQSFELWQMIMLEFFIRSFVLFDVLEKLLGLYVFEYVFMMRISKCLNRIHKNKITPYNYFIFHFQLDYAHCTSRREKWTANRLKTMSQRKGLDYALHHPPHTTNIKSSLWRFKLSDIE